MEEAVDRPEAPASLLWIGNEELDLDLFGIPLLDAEDDDATISVDDSLFVSFDSQQEKHGSTSSSSSDDLRVFLRPNNRTSNTRAVIQGAGHRPSHRQRQKQDIQMLRTHVAELERELRFLQSGASTKAASNASSMQIASPLTPTSGSGWRSIAKQQFEARESAEQENRMLRQTLQERIHMAKSLERVLLQHESVRSIPKRCPPRKIPRDHFIASTRPAGPWNSDWITVSSFQSEDVRLFHELLGHVNASAGNLGAVFKANGLDRMASEFRDARLKISPTIEPADRLPALAIEMLDVKILPFDLEETANVTWRCLESPVLRCTGIEWQQFSELADDNDVVVMRTDEGEALVHRVMRRFVHAGSGRISFVWESHLRLKDTGARLQQRGWLQLERQPPPSAAAGPTTILRMCFYVEPRSDLTDPNESDALHIDQQDYFTKISYRILPRLDMALTITYNTIQNILVEQSQNCRPLQ